MIRMVWREIQIIASAALVAALLWLYAEGATVKPQRIRLDVHLVPRQGQQLRITEPATSTAIDLDVPCTGSQYAALHGLEGKPFNLELPSDAPDQKLIMRDVLLADRRFSDRGVRTLLAQPDVLPVTTVALVTKKLPIVLDKGKLEIAGKATLSVDETTLSSLPADQAALLVGPDAAVRAYLDPDKVNPQENVPQQLEVALDLPRVLRPDSGIQLSPNTVTVTFTIRKGTRELVISQPITVLPSFNNPEFTASIDLSQYPKDLKVIGPVEVIDKLEKDLKAPPEANATPLIRQIYGSVRLTGDDLAKPGIISKQVEGFLGLPTGVTVTTLPPVLVTVTRVSPSPAPAPAPSGAGASAGMGGPALGAGPAPAVNPLVTVPLVNNSLPATQTGVPPATTTQPSP